MVFFGFELESSREMKNLNLKISNKEYLALFFYYLTPKGQGNY